MPQKRLRSPDPESGIPGQPLAQKRKFSFYNVSANYLKSLTPQTLNGAWAKVGGFSLRRESQEIAATLRPDLDLR